MDAKSVIALRGRLTVRQSSKHISRVRTAKIVYMSARENRRTYTGRKLRSIHAVSDTDGTLK